MLTLFDSFLGAGDVLLAAPASLGGGPRPTSSPTGIEGEADPVFLVSFWKPVVVVATLIGWAWIVATIYDKDAQRFFLRRRAWNLGHMAAGVVGVAAALLSPTFWIGWPAMLLILGLDLGAYAWARNASDRVPENAKWSLNLERMKEQRAARAEAKKARDVSMTFRGPKGPIGAPAKDSPEHPIRVAAEEILAGAMELRASRVEMQPKGDQTHAVSYVVDGVKARADSAPTQQAMAVMDLFKAASGLDVEDRRRRQRGEMEIERAGGGRRTLRVTTMGGSSGVRMTIVFDPAEQVRKNIDELGLLDPQKKEVEALIQEGAGAVLVAAPPQNGRTTTLYALVRAHDAYTSNVQTVELEPEDSIEGVRHNVFDPMSANAEYSTLVRSILRRDPDVLAIAELPDAATAGEVAKADHERTRTYVGLKADSALAATQTFMKAVGEAGAAGGALHGVIAQRLVRRLCVNCRVEYAPSAELLKKLGVSPEKVKKLYKKGGQVLIKNKPETCPVCGGSGFFGQEGVFEIFRLGDEERGLLRSGDLMGLRNALRKKRLPSIHEAAIHKVAAGVTSVEEVARVTQSSGQKTKKTAKGTPERGAA